MRIPALLTLVLMAAALAVSKDTPESRQCELTVRITDGDDDVPGLLRVTGKGGRRIGLDGLLRRGLGLGDELPINDWFVLTDPSTVNVPRERIEITATAGLETEFATIELDLTDRSTAAVELSPERFSNVAEEGYRSANTHLHLQKITREQSDRYLQDVPRADGLEMLFVSYLERAVADREYITNRYDDHDLARLTKASGVILGNGEEHRHNFAGFGQGYGHVMLLDIEKLIQPVSIGPGIMKTGTDGIPLQRGINTARGDQATIVWCHNNWGLEALPNFLSGRVDALNIFDGGTHGSFRDSFYRYLNAGIRVPFSTGTDWFMYDFSRVYVRMDGTPGVDEWLDGLAAGRSYITNGPLLEFRIDDVSIGDTLKLDGASDVRITARAVGRVDFERIEVVKSGDVILKADSRQVDDHFEADLSFVRPLTEPCWLALRTPPPPVKDDPTLQTPVPKNELGRDLFAHTSPIYVEVAGRKHFDRSVAGDLLAQMELNAEMIAANGNFADEQERQRVLDVYRDGIALLRKRIDQP